MAPVKDTPRRVYGGQTGDERAAQRRGALAEAAFALVAEHGWRGLNIEAICRRAGLNKRYFYEGFASLDAIMAAVMQRVAGDAIAAALDAFDPDLPLERATHGAIAALVDHLADDPRRGRVLFGAVPAGDAAAGHRAAAIHRIITTVVAEGRSINEIGADPAVDLAAAMLVGGTGQAMLDWLDGRIACSQEAFAADLAMLWHRVGEQATAWARERAAAENSASREAQRRAEDRGQRVGE